MAPGDAAIPLGEATVPGAQPLYDAVPNPRLGDVVAHVEAAASGTDVGAYSTTEAAVSQTRPIAIVKPLTPDLLRWHGHGFWTEAGTGSLQAGLVQSQTLDHPFPLFRDDLDQVAILDLGQHHVHVPRFIGCAAQAGAEAARPHLPAGQPDKGGLLPPLGVVGVGRLVLQKQGVQHLQPPRITGPHGEEHLLLFQCSLSERHLAASLLDLEERLRGGQEVGLRRHGCALEVERHLATGGNGTIEQNAFHQPGRDDRVALRQSIEPGLQIICLGDSHQFHRRLIASSKRFSSSGVRSHNKPTIPSKASKLSRSTGALIEQTRSESRTCSGMPRAIFVFQKRHLNKLRTP